MRPEGKNMYCFLIITGLHFLLTSVKESHGFREVDICKEEDKFRCEDGDIISLVDLECGSGNSCTQKVNETLFELCQGQQTCSTLGLGRMFAPQCHSDGGQKNSPRVKFNCRPGSTSTCLANICADTSAGLICPNGSAVHIRRLTCNSLTEKCSSGSYTSTYVCEGATRCVTTGLKAFLYQNCHQEVLWKRNVFVEYICVPEQQIENTCTSAVLDKDFGVLRSPHFSPDKQQTNTSCRWHINAAESEMVKITIHLVSTKIKQDGCDLDVFRITFVECSNRQSTTRSFCSVDNSSVELMSCGQVEITSTILQGEEYEDKFVVSYQRNPPNDPSILPAGLPSCIASPEKNVLRAQPVTPNRHSPKTSSRPMSVARNYGPGDGMFEYRDALYEEDAVAAENDARPTTFTKQLSLMILYIFFGVVIFVLVVALVAVIISYRRISKVKGHRSDYSEKTALWQHHEDTALDTFPSHILNETTQNQVSETVCGFKPSRDADQVVATIHHDAVSDQDHLSLHPSKGNGITSFLVETKDRDSQDRSDHQIESKGSIKEGLDNHYNNDYSYPEDGGYFEMGDAHHYHVPSNCEHNIYEVIDLSCSSFDRNSTDDSHPQLAKLDTRTDKIHGDQDSEVEYHNQLPATASQYSPSTDLHYRINDDEYAVVSKSFKSINPPDRVTDDEKQRKCDTEACIEFHNVSESCDEQGKIKC